MRHLRTSINPGRRDGWSAATASMAMTGAVFVVAAVVIVVAVNWNDRRLALHEAQDKARLLLDRNVATHHYSSSVLKSESRPHLGDTTVGDDRDATRISSTFAIRDMSARVNALSATRYYYKDAAINARSPGNEADELERQFLLEQSRPGAHQRWSGVRTIDGKPWWVTMDRGETMEAGCLGCHSSPDRAPPGLVERYGPTRSFARVEGELASIISIRIPLQDAYDRANRFSWRLSAALAVLLGVIFVVTSAIYRWFVLSPLERVRKHFEVVAEGSGDVGASIPMPRGRELQVVTEAFNKMASRIRAHQDDLEHQVDARTRALRESEARYRLLFEQSPIPMWVYDVETRRFLAVNDAAIEHYGYARDEFRAMTLSDIRPAEEIPRLEASCTGPQPAHQRSGVFTHRKRSGECIQVEIVSHAVQFMGRHGRLVLANDVTARVRAAARDQELQQRIRESHKMEAVGRLAGGVAHDFNNIATVIKSYAAFLLEAIPATDPNHADVQEIANAAERAANLTRQLLSFSRNAPPRAQVLDVNAIVRNMQKMMGRILGEDVRLDVRLGEDLWPIKIDVTHVEQVLTNLVVNAREAMPAGGRLTIETTNLQLDPDTASLRPEVKPGEYVVLTVSDDGQGMSAAVQERIFEPFFTTKRDNGTGLGLATVYGIVKQSGGFVAVASAVGAGSTFRIHFPRAMAVDEPARSERREALGGSGPNRKVLLVEDEPALRRSTRRLLEKHGFDVVEAGSGDEALAIATERRMAFDVILTDVVMPGKSGFDAVRAIRAIAPGVPALFMSGYTPDSIRPHGFDDRDTHFIAKPFASADLIDGLQRALRPAA